MKTNLKFYVVLTMVISLICIYPLNINAASASVSGPGTISVGGTGNIKINTNAPGGFFQGSITSNNPSIAIADKTGANADVGESATLNPTLNVVITGKNVGVATFTINIVGEDLQGNPFRLNTTITVNVTAKSSGGGVTPRPPAKESPAEKEARLKREQEARDKAEKEKKEAEEAKLKNTPLISNIEVVSDDLKRNGRVLNTIETEFNKFDYSYELPSFIEKIKINVTKLTEDVVVDFVSEQEVDGEKIVAIKASKGDINQVINLSLKSNSKELVKVDDGIVYEDEVLTNKFKDLGFEVNETEKNGLIFSKKDFRVQMVMTDDRQVLFNRVDDSGAIIDTGIVFVSNDETYYIVNSDNEEITSKSLYGKSYSNVELKSNDFLLDVDESLSFKPIVKGWEFEDGHVVFAMSDDGESSLYHIDVSNNIKSAVVAFDSNNSNNALTIALFAVSALFIVTGISFALYTKKTKKQLRHLIIKSEHEDLY